MQEIIIASKNQGKVREFAELLQPWGIRVYSLSEFDNVQEPQETGTSFMENAVLKAKYYALQYKKAALADDSGLSVDALGGQPGIYSARYAGEHGNDEANNLLLLKNMQGIADRSCKFVCALALVDAQGILVASSQGECAGELLSKPQGNNGFGYDPLFFSPELKKTLAQADMHEKNSVSHRSRAIRKLKEQLQPLLSMRR